MHSKINSVFLQSAFYLKHKYAITTYLRERNLCYTVTCGASLLDYYFKTVPKDEVTLDILDAQGKVVRHLSNKEKKEGEQPPEWPDRVERVKTIPAKEGMNRFAWDIRYNDRTQTPGAFYAGNGPKGPLALPGDYKAKLTVAGKSQTVPLKLVIDPRNKGAEPALQKQFALSTQVADRISQLHQAINEIRDVKAQIKTLHFRFGDDEKLKSALTAADDLDHKMSDVEKELIQVNMKGSEGNLAFPSMLNERFDSFSHFIDAGDLTEPTKPQQEVFQTLSKQLDDTSDRLGQRGIKAIARRTGLARNTVRTAIRRPTPPLYERPGRASAFGAYEQRVRTLLQEHPRMPASVLAERVGWERSESVFRRRVAELRPLYVPPVRITVIKNAPMSEPRIDPSPPASEPPPITTAAITSSSSPNESVGSPTVSVPNSITRGEATPWPARKRSSTWRYEQPERSTMMRNPGCPIASASERGAS